jgi:hypothetical protein
MSSGTPRDEDRVAEELRALLAEGRSVEEAVVALHRDRRLGVMRLWPAIMAATGVSRQEAMQLVVRCTHGLYWGEANNSEEADHPADEPRAPKPRPTDEGR